MTDEEGVESAARSNQALGDPTMRRLAVNVLLGLMESDADMLSSPEDADQATLPSALGPPEQLDRQILEEAKLQRVSPSETPRNTVPVNQQSEDTVVAKAPALGSDVAAAADEAFDNLKSQYGRYKRRWRVAGITRNRWGHVLGQGGQGIVRVVTDQRGFQRAVKLFDPAPYSNAEDYRHDMERLAKVALLVHEMGADNLLIVERFSQRKGVYFMVMKQIMGLNLWELLQPRLISRLREHVSQQRWKVLSEIVYCLADPLRPRLTPGMAVNIAEKCLRGLAALHKRRLVHADIKPANVMLDKYGSIKLIDIGSTFELDAPPQQHSLTPRYAPPEFHEKRAWTQQSDLASLGYVLIELLSGKPLIETTLASDEPTRQLPDDQNAALLEAKQALPGRLRSMLPADVQESKLLMRLLERLISPDPSLRFENAKEAIVNCVGTYEFNKELVKMRLAHHYASEIEVWLENVMGLDKC